MKTKEFIRGVEELGYFINKRICYYEITDVDENPIAVVSKTNFLQLSTNYSKWYELSEIDKKELFDLLVEYARTPIEDREEEKKFLIQHKYLVSKAFYPVCMVWHKLKDVYRPINCRVDNHIYKAQFTLKEIEEIKKKLNTDLADFELVEVEE